MFAAAALLAFGSCSATPPSTSTAPGPDVTGTPSGGAPAGDSSKDAAAAPDGIGSTGGTGEARAGLPEGGVEFLPEEELRDEAAAVPERAPSAPALSKAMSGGGSPGRPKATSSGLRAGFSDDNQQFGWFVDFLRTYAESLQEKRDFDISGRIVFTLVDSAGRPVPNARVTIRRPDGKPYDEARTYGDGSYAFYPPAGASAPDGGPWRFEASVDGSSQGSGSPVAAASFLPSGPRSVTVPTAAERHLPAPVPLDLVFVLDTTGSMGEEIERLKATIEIIKDNLDLATPRPDLRFGLVLYKDRGDEYLTKSFPLTSDLDAFQTSLASAEASGGGDESEDLESALAAAVSPRMGWSEDGIRLVFAITDAPAQTYPEGVPYTDTAAAAARRAIKIHAIGTGGLPLAGEYQLRQIAQRTRGRYIFLTYGERGESEGGAVGSVSHHTGSNWSAENLETVIIRFAREELALFSPDGAGPAGGEDWFEATPAKDRDAGAILEELFAKTVGNLADYSTYPIAAETPVAIMPISASDQTEARLSEYFGMHLLGAASTAKRFRLVERSDLQALLSEMELSLSALGDPANAAKYGALVGAELLIVPKLVDLGAAGGSGGQPAADAPRWELQLRLVRTDTAEILSVARARIASGLGL